MRMNNIRASEIQPGDCLGVDGEEDIVRSAHLVGGDMVVTFVWSGDAYCLPADKRVTLWREESPGGRALPAEVDLLAAPTHRSASRAVVVAVVLIALAVLLVAVI